MKPSCTKHFKTLDTKHRENKEQQIHFASQINFKMKSHNMLKENTKKTQESRREEKKIRQKARSFFPPWTAFFVPIRLEDIYGRDIPKMSFHTQNVLMTFFRIDMSSECLECKMFWRHVLTKYVCKTSQNKNLFWMTFTFTSC